MSDVVVDSDTSATTSTSGGNRTVVTNLATIIRSLEEASENDNRKIALLLILCELIRTGKLSADLGRENEERLFKSIGAHFLARLLVTRQQAPGQNCSKHIYKSVCLSILTQFCSHSKLIQDPLILTRISAFYDILKLPLVDEVTASSDTDERKLLVNLKFDTFKFLFAVAKYDPEFLCNNGLFDVLFNSVILNEAEATEYTLMGENFESNETDFGLLACKLVRTVLESFSSNSSDAKISKPHRFAENFSSFLSRIGSTKTKFKFQLVNYLNCLLASKSVTDEIASNEDLNETSAREIYSIVNELLRSKQEVQLAFFLLKHFVDLFQFEYIYMKDRKFFYFVIHVTCIQTALNLETAGQQTSLDDTSLALMAILYQLLEDVIIILSTASPFDSGDDDEDDEEDDEDDDDLDDDDDDDDYLPGKKAINKPKNTTDEPNQAKNEPELESVIKIVVELLESLMIYLNDILADCTNLDHINPKSIVLIASSIRLLMCWLAHESLLEKEILDLMPKFMRFADYVDNLGEQGDISSHDLFSFISAGAQKIYLNIKSRFDLKKSKSGGLKKLANDAKSEFEIFELSQEMDKVKLIMDTCDEHINNKAETS